MHSAICDVVVTAAAFEPVDVGFATEPGELAFGIVAMALLGLSHGLLAGDFILQNGESFGVAEGGERTAVWAVASDEAFGLFDEAAVEHGCGALVDAFVEPGAWRVEAQAKNAVAGES